MSIQEIPTMATPASADTAAPAVKPGKTPKGSITEHTYSSRGKAGEFKYRAEADWMILQKREKPIAEMFFMSYRKDTTDTRPVTFVFNGGPGAASAFLHVGALGPKRVVFGASGEILPPPVRLTDNESTWLEFTDLVFVDPIGTGFSRTIDEEPPKDAKEPASKGAADAKENDEFFQLNRDLESLGEFISKFLSKNKLWSRPVFIAGESYGGYRVGKLARKLQEEFGVPVNGAILISPAMEFSLLEGSDYDILMWSDLFPTLVAAAYHHGRSRGFAKGTALETVLKEAERFATHELVRWLALGAALAPEERGAIIAKAADYLGLSEEYVRAKGGRIAHFHFSRELLRDQAKIVGLYDASVVAVDPFPDRDMFQGADPTLHTIDFVFTSGINTQLRETLNVETDRDYHLLSMKVNMAWKNDTKRHVFENQVGATDDLRYAMALNPHMKVFFTHGYYDMVTPYFATNRLAKLMKLTPEQEKNLLVKHFKGGHMFYAWQESREAFQETARGFYRSAFEG